MKEIKFRVWDKEDKKMIYSGIIDNREFKGELYLSLSGEISIFVDEDGGKEGLWEHEIEYDKDRFVLMEYTGAIDNNRKEIYEGDILKVIVGNKYEYMEVYFKDGYFGWGKEHNGIYSFDPLDLEDIEVIGNIYENKELLNENKK